MLRFFICIFPVCYALFIDATSLYANPVGGNGAGGPGDVPPNLVDEGWTPLLWATYLGREEQALNLVEAGADIEARNQEGWNPLFLAAARGHIELFTRYAQAAPRVHDRDPEGHTLLHYASAFGLPALAERFMEHEADVNARRNDELTPLHLAAANNHPDLCAFLIAQSADVNAGSSLGSPLHMSAYGGHAEVVRVLLAAGARTDVVDAERNTPLHDAMSQGHREITDLLMAAGADPEAINQAGRKPAVPPDKVPVRFDHSDREAVRALAAQTERDFQQSVEARDMSHFYSVLAQGWRNHNSLTEIRAAFAPLLGLEPEERYWTNRDFVLEWPVTVDENGFLRIVVRYPGTPEHTFVEQVYLPESGKWKPGGYHLYQRVYNETWERYNREIIAHTRAGRPDDAVTWAHRALRFASDLAPPEPGLVILSAQTLAGLLTSQFDFDAAIAPRLLAVTLLEKIHGPAHSILAEELDQLYMAYVMAGRDAEENLCRQWGEDVRAATDGDPAAARRLEEHRYRDRLWDTVSDGPKPAGK